MKKYKGIFLADIHIGDMPRDQLKREFEEVIYPFISRHDLDFVIFAGDYFGHKLYLNDENTVLASMILQEIDARLKPEAKIRVDKLLHHGQSENLHPRGLQRGEATSH